MIGCGSRSPSLIDAMLRFFAMLTAAAIIVGRSFAAELVSESDVVGNWKIESSTFTVRELAVPNAFPRPQLPTNYRAFELILRKDGSFVATNVPAGVFFDWPAMVEASGKWTLDNNGDRWTLRTNGVSRNVSNVYSSFKLSFIKPSYGGWSRPVEWFGKDSSSPRKPAMILGPYKDRSKTYEYWFLITKQNQDNKP